MIFAIIGNAAVAVVYLFFWDSIQEMMPEEAVDQMPEINTMALGIVSILNLIFAILLFQWKKIGFWGFVATSIISLGLNIQAGLGIGQILGGLVGIAILYGILQIKKNDVSTWEGLE